MLMNTKLFRKSRYGKVFTGISIFVGGWEDSPEIFIKVPDWSLISQQISDSLFKLHASQYKVKIYDRVATVDCGVSLVFVPPELYNVAKVVWEARRVLSKGTTERTSEGLYQLFKDDPDYGIRRLAEIQRGELDKGNLLKSFIIKPGPFGLQFMRVR